MRHDPREPRNVRGESHRRDEQRPFRREASPRRDWYEQDEMDERSGYRDEGYRPSSEYRASEYRDTSDYRRDFNDSSPDYGRTQESRELSRGSRAIDGNRHGSSYESASSGRSEERSRYFGRGPKSYKRSDERIKEDVCEMLTRDNNIDAEGIDVEVKDGEVTLTGTVPERRMKHLAEDCAEGCYGVKDVINNIRVSRDTASPDRSDRSSGMGAKKPSSSTSPNAPNH
ncbi:BON domain-containing protein [Bdellovibrio bacteriovorus]|uniref:BON domain-containing protein n=1 Tax=Bdellovibrio bacteriovorus TaxID=959 RepID=UPI00045BEA15|nr:BON domain-containing protein [Bdellovibrio bacteriovorus]AHZ84785.1 hypothetical protein EP01_07510 [Bdellovibrio bacteriovorus]BEV68671.1 hypothetical protein Bb109J_c2091 [Bdellovibrio bacteriovorus]